MQDALIDIRSCAVSGKTKLLLPPLDWQMRPGEAWLVTGANGSGCMEFIGALSGELDFVPEGADGAYSSAFRESTAVVSLEKAAALIQEERANDESEILNREDEGRTGRRYLCEVTAGPLRRNDPLPPEASHIESLPQVALCGVAGILDRGLKHMSTGELRRLLLCRALLSGSRLLVLSNPFAGLDASSKSILMEFFGRMADRQTSGADAGSGIPAVILCTDRFHEVPAGINRVLEFSARRVSFCGTRSQYEAVLSGRMESDSEIRRKKKAELIETLDGIRRRTGGSEENLPPDELVSFSDVNVGWGEHKVLVNVSWTVRRGEHWFIRGPNGSGKTTLLELITGDNMQVFREDVRLFGRRRGSGETLWDIRRHLGIVSYRLHVEYRMVGGTSVEAAVVSGFHDSIGLYEPATDVEREVARAWLRLSGFAGREKEAFGSLSYGEQRAVLILRAAVKCPHLLILDEPCHGLDEANRTIVLDLLETVAQTGTTTLLHVTHDPSEALACEHHVLELCPGNEPMYRILDRHP